MEWYGSPCLSIHEMHGSSVGPASCKGERIDSMVPSLVALISLLYLDTDTHTKEIKVRAFADNFNSLIGTAMAVMHIGVEVDLALHILLANSAVSSSALHQAWAEALRANTD